MVKFSKLGKTFVKSVLDSFFLYFMHIINVLMPFEGLNLSKLKGFLHILVITFCLYLRMHAVKKTSFLH